MKKICFVLAVMAMGLVACNKESAPLSSSPKHEELLGNGLKYIEIAISQEKATDAETKAAISDNVKLSFGVGDQIAVLATKDATTTVATLTYVSYDDVNKKVVFGGTIDEDAAIGNYAYYPASIATTTELTINWPTAVDGAKVQVPMVAYLDKAGNSATFKYLGAIAKIAVASCPAGAKKLKFTAASNITGSYTVNDFQTGNPTATASSLSGKTITASISGNNTYYVPLPAGTYSGFQFALVNNDDTFYYKQKTAKSETSLTLGRTQIANMGTLTYDVDEIEAIYLVSKSNDWATGDDAFRLIKTGANTYRAATWNGWWESDINDYRGCKVYYNSSLYGVSTQYQTSGTFVKDATHNALWTDANSIYSVTVNNSTWAYSTTKISGDSDYCYKQVKLHMGSSDYSMSAESSHCHIWKYTGLAITSNASEAFYIRSWNDSDVEQYVRCSSSITLTDSTPYGTISSWYASVGENACHAQLTEGDYDVYFNDATGDIMFVRVYPPAKSTGLEDMSLSNEYNI